MIQTLPLNANVMQDLENDFDVDNRCSSCISCN